MADDDPLQRALRDLERMTAEERRLYEEAHQRNQREPFLMGVADWHPVAGRGTLAQGRIARGVVRPGDRVELVGMTPTIATQVVHVEMARKHMPMAQAGEEVGIIVPGLRVGSEAIVGQVLAAPGSILPFMRFTAELYLLTKDEGGRHTPFFNGYRPQFYFWNADVTGTVTLPDDIQMMMPGETGTIAVELLSPVAIEARTRFAVRERGRTVGAGTVIATSA